MRKLYLISYYFAPLGRADGINRTYLVKYLSEMGWDVAVISCANPHGFIRSFQKDPSLLDVLPSNVKLNRIKSFYWGPLGEIASLLKLAKDPFWNWGQAVLKQVDHLFKGKGIVYAIAPPVRNVLIAATIAKKKNMPLIIDFRDNVFDLPKSIVAQAKTIIASTSNSLIDMQKFYGMNSNNGHVIYNGYPVKKITQGTKKASTSKKLQIIFTGLLYYQNDPVVLIRAVNYLESKFPELRNKIEVNYYGPHNYYTIFFLKKKLRENIYFHGFVPFKTVLSKIADSDFAYCPIAVESNSYAIPSKVFQYIAMEIPILAVGPNGALKDLIVKNGIGRFSHYNDLEGQTNDLYELVTKPQLKRDMIENLKKIKDRFFMKEQVGTLSPLLDKFI